MKKPVLVGAEVKALGNLLKRRMDANPLSADPMRPTGMQGMIMGFLAFNYERDMFQRDVEAEFNIRRSTATGILKLMERNGLIVKESVPYDDRLKKLVLTPEALAIHEKVVAHFTEVENLLIRGLTREEIDMFLRIVGIMKENIS